MAQQSLKVEHQKLFTGVGYCTVLSGTVLLSHGQSRSAGQAGSTDRLWSVGWEH